MAWVVNSLCSICVLPVLVSQRCQYHGNVRYLPSNEIISTISCFQSRYGQPFLASIDRLAGTSSSIWMILASSSCLWISFWYWYLHQYLRNTPRAAGSDPNSVHASTLCERTGSISELYCIVIPVGKSKYTFDIQAVLIFVGNGGDRVKKLVHNIEGIVVGQLLGFYTPYGPLLFNVMVSISLAYASSWTLLLAWQCSTGL